MRLIGNVDSKPHAERFSAYLMTQDISAHCELENETWEIWIRDEDQIEQASKFLDAFKAEPDDRKYQGAIEQAQLIARESEKKRQQVQKNLVQMQNRWNSPITRRAPLTITLVVICVIVAVLTNFGYHVNGAAFRSLTFSSVSDEQAFKTLGVEGLNTYPYDTSLRLASITRGEVWRLITPIFIHFGPVHLLFNMYMLVVFGSQIEGRYGALWLAILIVLTAIPANLLGSIVPEAMDGKAMSRLDDNFTMLAGGFSGVLYGMFGYIWMKMVFDPQSGLFLTRATVTFLMALLLICMVPGFTEQFGIHIDNWAHGTGMVSGLIIGYTPKMLSDMGLGRAKPGKP